jgi:hypothetical protein
VRLRPEEKAEFIRERVEDSSIRIVSDYPGQISRQFRRLDGDK